MRYSIDHTKSPGESLKFLVLKELEYIISQIESKDQNMHKSIHEARKGFKKVRAMLRLIRDEIGYSSYYRENVFYRDLSRNLSGIRTFRQHEACLRNLKKKMPDSIQDEKINATVKQLKAQRDEYLEEIKKRNVFSKTSNQIKQAKQRILDFEITKNDFSLVEPGLRRMFRQGKKYYNACLQDPSTENLHNLRKRVKYLWYQLLLLKPVFPKMIKASYKNFEIISELIGDHRDFQEFIAYFEKNDYLGFDEKIVNEIYRIVNESNIKRLEKAMMLGAKLFYEKPSDFTRRIEVYWEVENTEFPELLNSGHSDPFY